MINTPSVKIEKIGQRLATTFTLHRFNSKAVFAVTFNIVHSFVCGFKQAGYIVAMFWISCNANAHTNMDNNL